MRNKYNVTQNVTPPTTDYPFGRINDNDGTGNGTPIVEAIYGDIHEFFAALLTSAQITPNDLPDNFTNGHQSVQALYQFASKHNVIKDCEITGNTLTVGQEIFNMTEGQFLVQRFQDQNEYRATSGVSFIKNENKPETFDLFFNEDFLMNTTYVVIQKISAGFLCTTLANGIVLNKITEAISALESQPTDYVIDIGNRTINSSLFTIPITANQRVFENILSWELMWETYSVEGGLTLTDFQTNKSINMTTGQEIMFGKFSDSVQQGFIRFSGFNGKVLNKAKLTIKYKPLQSILPV